MEGLSLFTTSPCCQNIADSAEKTAEENGMRRDKVSAEVNGGNIPWFENSGLRCGGWWIDGEGVVTGMGLLLVSPGYSQVDRNSNCDTEGGDGLPPLQCTCAALQYSLSPEQVCVCQSSQRPCVPERAPQSDLDESRPRVGFSEPLVRMSFYEPSIPACVCEVSLPACMCGASLPVTVYESASPADACEVLQSSLPACVCNTLEQNSSEAPPEASRTKPEDLSEAGSRCTCKQRQINSPDNFSGTSQGRKGTDTMGKDEGRQTPSPPSQNQSPRTVRLEIEDEPQQENDAGFFEENSPGPSYGQQVQIPPVLPPVCCPEMNLAHGFHHPALPPTQHATGLMCQCTLEHGAMSFDGLTSAGHPAGCCHGMYGASPGPCGHGGSCGMWLPVHHHHPHHPYYHHYHHHHDEQLLQSGSELGGCLVPMLPVLPQMSDLPFATGGTDAPPAVVVGDRDKGVPDTEGEVNEQSTSLSCTFLPPRPPPPSPASMSTSGMYWDTGNDGLTARNQAPDTNTLRPYKKGGHCPPGSPQVVVKCTSLDDFMEKLQAVCAGPFPGTSEVETNVGPGAYPCPHRSLRTPQPFSPTSCQCLANFLKRLEQQGIVLQDNKALASFPYPYDEGQSGDSSSARKSRPLRFSSPKDDTTSSSQATSTSGGLSEISGEGRSPQYLSPQRLGRGEEESSAADSSMAVQLNSTSFIRRQTENSLVEGGDSFGGVITGRVSESFSSQLLSSKESSLCQQCRGQQNAFPASQCTNANALEKTTWQVNLQEGETKRVCDGGMINATVSVDSDQRQQGIAAGGQCGSKDQPFPTTCQTLCSSCAEAMQPIATLEKPMTKIVTTVTPNAPSTSTEDFYIPKESNAVNIKIGVLLESTVDTKAVCDGIQRLFWESCEEMKRRHQLQVELMKEEAACHDEVFKELGKILSATSLPPNHPDQPPLASPLDSQEGGRDKPMEDSGAGQLDSSSQIQIMPLEKSESTREGWKRLEELGIPVSRSQMTLFDL